MANYSDLFRKDYKAYAEPVLLTAASHQGEKKGLTRSEWIREAIIEKAIREGYPLKNISNKFNEFYRGITHNL
jgi:hypothetical protein